MVCLFGCWVEALAAAALEREEGFWRKAAKKVERKKGRCEDMLGVIALVAAFSGIGLVWRVVMVSLARSRGRAGGDIGQTPPAAERQGLLKWRYREMIFGWKMPRPR